MGIDKPGYEPSSESDGSQSKQIDNDNIDTSTEALQKRVQSIAERINADKQPESQSTENTDEGLSPERVAKLHELIDFSLSNSNGSFSRKISKLYPYPLNREMLVALCDENWKNLSASGEEKSLLVIDGNDQILAPEGVNYSKRDYGGKDTPTQPNHIASMLLSNYIGARRDSWESSRGKNRQLLDAKFANDQSFVLLAKEDSSYSHRTIETHFPGEGFIHHSEKHNDLSNQEMLDYIILDLSGIEENNIQVIEQYGKNKPREKTVDVHPFTKE